MDVLWIPFLKLMGTIIHLYTWVIIVLVILNWLTNFGLVNRYNPFISNLFKALDQLTAPVLRPLQRILPTFGNLDLSPLVLLLILYFLENVISMLILKAMIPSEVSLQKL